MGGGADCLVLFADIGSAEGKSVQQQPTHGHTRRTPTVTVMMSLSDDFNALNRITSQQLSREAPTQSPRVDARNRKQSLVG
jgi:hypothetical protein